MEISAADVKKLRERTGAGMMECKNALASCEGDFDKAEKLLKEKGLAAVEKRSGRATNEGKVFVRIANGAAALAELATETDFVARNPEFIALGDAIVATALEKGHTGPVEELSARVADLAAKIRENMSLKRLKTLKADTGEILSSYIHGDGNIGVVVKLGADKPEALEQEEARAFAFDLAMHIAAFNPLALDQTRVDPAFLKEQEEIFRKQMEQDESLRGKPEKVLENILKGKLSKYLADICLAEQGFIKDEKLTVNQALAEKGKALGAALSVNDYAYFKVGQ
jgi:elongation factor Ts